MLYLVIVTNVIVTPVSGVQKAIYFYIYMYLFFFKLFSHLGY